MSAKAYRTCVSFETGRCCGANAPLRQPRLSVSLLAGRRGACGHLPVRQVDGISKATRGGQWQPRWQRRSWCFGMARGLRNPGRRKVVPGNRRPRQSQWCPCDSGPCSARSLEVSRVRHHLTGRGRPGPIFRQRRGEDGRGRWCCTVACPGHHGGHSHSSAKEHRGPGPCIKVAHRGNGRLVVDIRPRCLVTNTTYTPDHRVVGGLHIGRQSKPARAVPPSRFAPLIKMALFSQKTARHPPHRPLVRARRLRDSPTRHGRGWRSSSNMQLRTGSPAPVRHPSLGPGGSEPDGPASEGKWRFELAA